MSLPYFNLANLYAIAIPWAPPPTMTILASLGKLARFGSMLLPNLSFDLKIIDMCNVNSCYHSLAEELK